MAGNISDFLENKLLDHSTGRLSYSAPAATYCALFTSAPSDSAPGTEVSTTSTAYGRQSITWGAATGGAISNSADITFATASANWGTITHIGIFDATTAGNMLWYGQLTSSKIVNSGDIFKITTGNLQLTLD